MTMQRPVLFTTLLSVSAIFATSLWAVPQPQSVAEASRKARAEKKEAPGTVRTLTNDNLESLKGTVSVVGQAPAPAAAPAEAAQPAAPGAAEGKPAAGTPDAAPAGAADASKPEVKDEKYWRDTFAVARKKLADDEHELDILQREYNLKQQQYYSDPNTAMREQFNRQDLTDTKTKIDQKTADVAKDKQDITRLEDELRQAGGEPGWSRPQ